MKSKVSGFFVVFACSLLLIASAWGQANVIVVAESGGILKILSMQSIRSLTPVAPIRMLSLLPPGGTIWGPHRCS